MTGGGIIIVLLYIHRARTGTPADCLHKKLQIVRYDHAIVNTKFTHILFNHSFTSTLRHVQARMKFSTSALDRAMKIKTYQVDPTGGRALSFPQKHLFLMPIPYPQTT